MKHPYTDSEPCFLVQSEKHLFIAPQDTVREMLHLSEEKAEEIFNVLCGVDGIVANSYDVGEYNISYVCDLWQTGGGE